MTLIVQKYGGSSVADIEKIKNVAKRIIKTRRKGNNVVVVVSAPGNMTDELIELAEQLSPVPHERELDMLLATGEQRSIALLAMAIHTQGEDAISFTGPQCGIITDVSHGRARIKNINTARLVKELKRTHIIIVAGFQGISSEHNITTLGRGGSDLTAVALASALKADVCEIYTDVDGIYNADPRLVPDARKIDRISYDEILEMAGSGSQVMQARSIEVAKKYNVDIHVRSAFSNREGTIICKEAPMMEDVVVSGVSHEKDIIKMSIIGVKDRPGIVANIFGALADEGVNVDMIVQSTAISGENDVSFTIKKTDLKKSLIIMEQVRKLLKAKKVLHGDNVAKLSIVGVGMKSHPGIAAKLFSVLAKEKINIQMISTSEIRVACVIDSGEIERAVKAVHKSFGLGKK